MLWVLYKVYEASRNDAAELAYMLKRLNRLHRRG